MLDRSNGTLLSPVQPKKYNRSGVIVKHISQPAPEIPVGRSDAESRDRGVALEGHEQRGVRSVPQRYDSYNANPSRGLGVAASRGVRSDLLSSGSSSSSSIILYYRKRVPV